MKGSNYGWGFTDLTDVTDQGRVVTAAPDSNDSALQTQIFGVVVFNQKTARLLSACRVAS